MASNVTAETNNEAKNEVKNEVKRIETKDTSTQTEVTFHEAFQIQKGPASVEFSVKTATEPLSEWLEKFMPTKIFKRSGTEWIKIQGKTFEENDYKPSDESGLEYKYHYLERKKALDTHELLQVAGEYNIVSGKWLFHLKTKLDVDKIWSRVANKIAQDEFHGISNYAKVSTTSDGSDSYVICIYSKDFRNESEVFALEKAIRDIGILETLRYKPDVFSFCGVYADSNSGIRSVILVSEYDSTTGKSNIVEPKKKTRRPFWMS